MPKKGEIRQWDAENMKNSIQAVKVEKLGILLASELYLKVACIIFLRNWGNVLGTNSKWRSLAGISISKAKQYREPIFCNQRMGWERLAAWLSKKA